MEAKCVRDDDPQDGLVSGGDQQGDLSVLCLVGTVDEQPSGRTDKCVWKDEPQGDQVDGVDDLQDDLAVEHHEGAVAEDAPGHDDCHAAQQNHLQIIQPLTIPRVSCRCVKFHNLNTCTRLLTSNKLGTDDDEQTDEQPSDDPPGN